MKKLPSALKTTRAINRTVGIKISSIDINQCLFFNQKSKVKFMVKGLLGC